MEILQFCLSILNMVLYYSFLMVNMIFDAFGITWLGFVCGLAVVSVLLRLFAANLVGAAVALHDRREAVARQERLDRHSAQLALGPGSSYAALPPGRSSRRSWRRKSRKE